MTKRKKDYSNLPVYRMVVNKNDETGVQLISIVDEPAIGVKGIYLKKNTGVVTPPCHPTHDGTPNCQCDIIYNPLIGDYEWITGENPCLFCLENKAKWDELNQKFSKRSFSADNEQNVIVGPVLIPDIKMYRSGKEDGSGPHLIYFAAEDIKLLVQKFNRRNNNRSIDVMHSGKIVNAFIMENWLVADPVFDKSKLYGYNLPKDTWFMSMQIEDEQFWANEVKELGQFSFSVQATLGQQLVEFALNEDNNDDFSLELLSNKQLIELGEYALKLLRK